MNNLTGTGCGGDPSLSVSAKNVTVVKCKYNKGTLHQKYRDCWYVGWKLGILCVEFYHALHKYSCWVVPSVSAKKVTATKIVHKKIPKVMGILQTDVSVKRSLHNKNSTSYLCVILTQLDILNN